jgi:peptidoglycan/LPS O-acetylase OafA/YrhL
MDRKLQLPGEAQYANFDTLRLLAAVGVLISHSFPLTFGNDDREPLMVLSGGAATVGTICVWIFFAISGFLITRSYVLGTGKSAPAVRFIRARILRIVPALIVVLLLTVFLLGPILTTVSLKEFFSTWQTWSFLFLNLTFLTFHDGLVGVFDHNPFASSVNGSLWTLRWEVRCYVIVLLLGALRLLNLTSVAVLFAIALLVSAWSGGEVANLFLSFAAGALIFLGPGLLHPRIAAPALCVLGVSCFIPFTHIALPLFISYAAIWLGVSKRITLPRLASHGDFSYGVYIYAFPIQQCVTLFMANNATWYWNVLISTPITFFFAVLSWRLVEQPALTLKKSPAAQIGSSFLGLDRAPNSAAPVNKDGRMRRRLRG